MVRLLLRISLYGLGASACLIGAMMISLGAEWTGNFFGQFACLSECTPVTGLSDANTDNEMRFYSVFWFAYGVILILTAGKLDLHIARVPLLAGLFFAGGLARIPSLLALGHPHDLFLILMGLELCVPIIIVTLWWLNRETS